MSLRPAGRSSALTIATSGVAAFPQHGRSDRRDRDGMTRNKKNRRLRLSSLVLVPALITGAAQTAAPALGKPAKMADLKVASVLALDTWVKPGAGFPVSATVANGGKTKAKASKVRFYLSTDKARGRDIRVAATGRARALAPGRKVVSKANIVVPASAKEGAYYVLACADAPGKDARRSNDCRASTGRATVVAAWKGTLTGTLTFDKGYTTSSADSKETSADHATVDVNINVDESKSGWAAFGNAGSTYGYTGSHHMVYTSTSCVSDEKRKAEGGGALIQNGNPYEDDILGKFGKVDHSEFDLLIDLNYQRTITTTHTPVGELGCFAGTDVDGPKPAENSNEIEFHQISRTSRSITYDVAEVLGDYSTKTDWAAVSGKLTLTRR
jgi:hypothetical protein